MKMRKPVSVFALCLALSFGAHAQIKVGAKVGANINQFNQPGTVFGFTGGAFGKYQVLDFLDVRGEILYNQQGGARQDYWRDYSELNSTVYGIYYTNRFVNLHNLEFPVIAELHHPSFEDEIISPRLLLGFAYGLNLGAFERHEKTYYFNEGPVEQIMISDQKENVGANYKASQWGFIAGFGIDMKAGEQTCTFEVRYRGGLNQINNFRFGVPPQDGLPGTIGQEGDLYTSSLSVAFGMTIKTF